MQQQATIAVKLTTEQQYDLIGRAQAGDMAARDEMVAANMGLVYKAVLRHARHIRDAEDLVQEGSVGLLKAIERFDLSSSNQFSTYATHWVKAYVYRALADYSLPLLTIPSRVLDETMKIHHALERCNTTDVASIAHATDLPTYRVAAVLPWLMSTIGSLDSAVGDDDEDGCTLGRFLADEEAGYEACDEAYEFEVEHYLAVLSPRERQVIEMLYGLGRYRYDSGSTTLAAIGHKIGRSGELARQIHGEALRKMRVAAGRVTG